MVYTRYFLIFSRPKPGGGVYFFCPYTFSQYHPCLGRKGFAIEDAGVTRRTACSVRHSRARFRKEGTLRKEGQSWNGCSDSVVIYNIFLNFKALSGYFAPISPHRGHGPRRPTGPMGPIGRMGLMGLMGPMGTNGAHGAHGAQGAQGAHGALGAHGAGPGARALVRLLRQF